MYLYKYTHILTNENITEIKKYIYPANIYFNAKYISIKMIWKKICIYLNKRRRKNLWKIFDGKSNK